MIIIIIISRILAFRKNYNHLFTAVAGSFISVIGMYDIMKLQSYINMWHCHYQCLMITKV